MPQTGLLRLLLNSQQWVKQELIQPHFLPVNESCVSQTCLMYHLLSTYLSNVHLSRACLCISRNLWKKFEHQKVSSKVHVVTKFKHYKINNVNINLGTGGSELQQQQHHAQCQDNVCKPYQNVKLFWVLLLCKMTRGGCSDNQNF